jgi:soluble lytic murein transglycosylase-like protein
MTTQGPSPAAAGTTNFLGSMVNNWAGRIAGSLQSILGRGQASSSGGAALSAGSFESCIATAAARHDLSTDLVKAVIKVESGFNPRAQSKVGAKGLMQLMDGTARSLGVQDSFDPAQNIEGGVTYLRNMLDRFGSVPLALAAYNAGPGAVEHYGGVPPYAETQRYVQQVMALAHLDTEA